jgi:hypothetical protein
MKRLQVDFVVLGPRANDPLKLPVGVSDSVSDFFGVAPCLGKAPSPKLVVGQGFCARRAREEGSPLGGINKACDNRQAFSFHDFRLDKL